METPTGSFTKFLLGFIVFVSMSLGLTLAVGTQSESKSAQTEAQKAAAVEAAKNLMLEWR